MALVLSFKRFNVLVEIQFLTKIEFLESKLKMNRFLQKRSIDSLFTWITINLYSAIIFTLAVIKEISSGDFPKYQPFFTDRPVDPIGDLFRPMFDFPMIIFGFVTGICVFAIAFLLASRRSKHIRYLFIGSGISLTLFAFWGGILLINVAANNLQCSLLPGGGGLGCLFPEVKLQQWHRIIGVIGSFGLAALWALWLKRLSLKRSDN